MKPLLAIVMLGVVACGGSSAAVSTTTAPTTTTPTTTTEALPTIDGSVVILETLTYNGPCSGQGGYDDIEGGANVVVKNGDGSTIGVGRLDPGETIVGPNRLPQCAFDFEVELTATADFYTVEIAGRGGPTYSNADMESSGWVVELSLG